MSIDWQAIGFAAQADANFTRAKKAEESLSEASSNLEGVRRKLRDREQHISVLERKLAEAEDELRHAKSQVAGFIAEVRFFIEKTKEHSDKNLRTLSTYDNDGKRPIDYIYADAYNNYWDSYKISSR